MGVNVIVCGADKSSDEYIAALKLKQIIPDTIANRNTCQILTESQIVQFEKNILSFRNNP